MADSVALWHGIEEAKAALRAIPAKLRRRALRNALAAAARPVRDAAQAGAPVISSLAPAVLKGWRKPGTLRKAIRIRTSKQARREGNVGVFVNVKPAPGGLVKGVKQRGAKNPNDPYYWRWLEFGRTARAGQGARDRVARNKARGVKGVRFRRALTRVGAIAPIRFLQNAAQRLRDALVIFQQVLGPQIARLNVNPKDPL